MKKLLLATIPVIFLFSACGPKRLLMGNTFYGEDKVRKVFIHPSEKVKKDGRTYQLYDYYLRICSLNPANQETNCKDTLVLKNVDPSEL